MLSRPRCRDESGWCSVGLGVESSRAGVELSRAGVESSRAGVESGWC